MFSLVYNVIDIIQLIDRKNNYPYDPYKIDESLIDQTLKECWVVYGPCLPTVNGSYEYQKDYTKETANKFNNLVNALSINGRKEAKAQIREALGIE